MRLNIWLLIQFCLIFVMIDDQVAGNTKSNNQCSFDQESLWLNITTGNKFFAGTDDHVHVFLLGANDIVCQDYLDNSGNDRRRNHVDQYIICCPKGLLSDDQEINMFSLTHMAYIGTKGGATYNDWFIERIELGTGGKIIFNYHLHAWTSSQIQGTVLFSRVDKKNYVHF